MTRALTPNSHPTLNSAQVTTTLRKSRIRDFPLTPRLTPHSKLSTPSFTTMFQKPLILEHVVLLSGLEIFVTLLNICNIYKNFMKEPSLLAPLASLLVPSTLSVQTSSLLAPLASLEVNLINKYSLKKQNTKINPQIKINKPMQISKR